jgi:hypothetical protein
VSKNKSKYDRASLVVAGPGAHSSSPLPRALCAALLSWVGYVRGSRGWRSRPPTAGSGGGGVSKGAPEPDGTSPSGRCLWSSRAWRDGTPPLAAWSSRSHGTGPLPVDRTSASFDAAAANASRARCGESLKSSIIARCCSCVGWVPTGGAPISCVPPILSAVSRNWKTSRP